MLKVLLILGLCIPACALATPSTWQKLPKFVSPLKLNNDEDLPKGSIVKKGDLICYDKPAHSRLLIFVKNVEPSSNLRALAAWNDAYLLGYEEGGLKVLRLKEEKQGSLFFGIISSKYFWFSVGAVSAAVLTEMVK